MTVTQTRFGEVDTAVLEELRESFDTHALLDAVAKIDQIRHCIDAVREELLRLHGMAHDLINDAGFTGGIGEDAQPIWDLADGLSMTMLDWPDDIDFIGDMLDKLAELAPDPDDDDLADDAR